MDHNFSLPVTLLIIEMTSTMFKTEVKPWGAAKRFHCKVTAVPISENLECHVLSNMERIAGCWVTFYAIFIIDNFIDDHGSWPMSAWEFLLTVPVN